MDLTNIKRNQLDYMLTDVMPTELSDRFTYTYFYEYLINNNKEITRIVKELVRLKNKNGKEVLFNGNKNWVTAPLKYTIMKQLHN